MQFSTGDTHFVEPETMSRTIDTFNEQLQEEGHFSRAQTYEDNERNYVSDVQSGDYSSDYRKIQIAQAIERIQSKICHFKPSRDGQVLAPGEESQGMMVDGAPSGSESYRDYYFQEMQKRVSRNAPMEDEEYVENPSKIAETCEHGGHSMRRRHRSSGRR